MCLSLVASVAVPVAVSVYFYVSVSESVSVCRFVSCVPVCMYVVSVYVGVHMCSCMYDDTKSISHLDAMKS